MGTFLPYDISYVHIFDIFSKDLFIRNGILDFTPVCGLSLSPGSNMWQESRLSTDWNVKTNERNKYH